MEGFGEPGQELRFHGLGHPVFGAGAADHDQVVRGQDEGEVAAGAEHAHHVGGQIPAEVAFHVGAHVLVPGRGPGALDPFRVDDLLVLPAALAEDEVGEAGVVPRGHAQPAVGHPAVFTRRRVVVGDPGEADGRQDAVPEHGRGRVAEGVVEHQAEMGETDAAVGPPVAAPGLAARVLLRVAGREEQPAGYGPLRVAAGHPEAVVAPEVAPLLELVAILVRLRQEPGGVAEDLLEGDPRLARVGERKPTLQIGWIVDRALLGELHPRPALARLLDQHPEEHVGERLAVGSEVRPPDLVRFCYDTNS